MGLDTYTLSYSDCTQEIYFRYPKTIRGEQTFTTSSDFFNGNGLGIEEINLIYELLRYEILQDEKHSVVLALLKQGNFSIASQMFSQMNDVYFPKNKIEMDNFCIPRFRQIDRVLENTKTIRNVLVVGEDTAKKIKSEEITGRVMMDLPKLKFGGKHTLRYKISDNGEWKLTNNF